MKLLKVGPNNVFLCLIIWRCFLSKNKNYILLDILTPLLKLK